MKIKCRTISRGCAEGKVMITRDPISFLGTIDPNTGKVVDADHELFGQSVKDKVLVFPYGKGSTVGSYVIYQLSKNGTAPAAMINLESEPIVAVGAIISAIPLVDRLEYDPYSFLSNGILIKVNSSEGYVEVSEDQCPR
ncbi:MAG: DUF126 domain-containing protein [Methanomethylovorans sp.]|uniref:DUF126 domain-containing protein n=1 Tax=Methanomethylovorans sp. TaxID=2758717 RepID=UPI000A9B8E97|nr:DUF126 domain-containing protein [Methanomethylovorans sp.]